MALTHDDRDKETNDRNAAALVRDAAVDLTKLVQTELELARSELRRDAREARDAAMVGGASALAMVVGLEIVVGGLFTRGLRRIGFLTFGAAIVAAGAAGARAALGMFPDVLARTRRRAKKDVALLEERLA